MKIKKNKPLIILIKGVIITIFLLSPFWVHAFQNPGPLLDAALDFDIRGDRVRAFLSAQEIEQIKTPAIENEINLLRAKVKNLKMRWSNITLAPSRIYSINDTLTGPSSEPSRVIASNFLSENLTLLRLLNTDISETRFSKDYKTKHNGVSHLTIQQQVNGIDVFGCSFKVNIDNEGRILNVGGEFIPSVHANVNTDSPVITDQAALENAIREADIINVNQTRVKGLIYFPINKSEIRLAWNVIVVDGDTPNEYQSIVDAVDGTVLWRRNNTQYANGLVFTSDSPDPDTPTGTSDCSLPAATYPDCNRDREDVPFDGRDFFDSSDDHYDWWNDSTGGSDTSTTKSNNVHTKEDTDSDNDDSEGFPSVTGGDFSFTIDLSQAPSTEDSSVQNQSAAIVNAFYWINRIHDIYYSLGFDEAAGNFQSDNFGLGGTGGDAVQADVQDSAKNCNAGFSSTHTDGDPVRMTMFLCSNSTPQRDAAFENLIIIHEYTHGLVKRLVEVGPYSSQSGGLQDGSCDFMGLAITSEPDDDLTQDYPRGQWYYNNVAGNRRQPYSTNQSVFTRTYANISDNDDPWPAGEIWCNTMWMARTNFVWKHGFDPGGQTMLQVYVDGLKNAPSRPDYLDVRDAILQADTTNNGGANHCILWDAFAKMGMGDSASSTGDTDSAPTEAFDIPAECEPDVDVDGEYDFGSLCLGASQDEQLRVTNEDDSGDLIISSISSISGTPDITVDPLAHPVFLGPGESTDFFVRCGPTSCGSKMATIRLETNDPDQPEIDLEYTCDGDTLEPDLTCPADITIGCAESTAPSNTGEASASDTCSTPVINYTDSTIPGICPEESVITRTWTAADDCGNTVSCSQTITVEDNTAPTLSEVPEDLTVECDAVPEPADITATDNCDPSPSISYSETRTDGDCASNYTLIRTWTAVDACGNSTSETQIIAVQDTTPPVISCNAPAAITPPDAPISFTATATDNCDELPSAVITGYDCYMYTKKDKTIDKKESCVVETAGNQITILDSGGVGDHIMWTVEAADNCSNISTEQCEVLVINPTQ